MSTRRSITGHDGSTL